MAATSQDMPRPIIGKGRSKPRALANWPAARTTAATFMLAPLPLCSAEPARHRRRQARQFLSMEDLQKLFPNATPAAKGSRTRTSRPEGAHPNSVLINVKTMKQVRRFVKGASQW